MAIELRIPAVGESISEVEIGEWRKSEGDAVAKDEIVALLESEKATVELPAPAAGVMGKILKKRGETAAIGETIAMIEEGGSVDASAPVKAKEKEKKQTQQAPAPAPAPERESARIMPSAQRALAETKLEAERVKATGPGGRMLKEDVLRQADLEREKSPVELVTETKPAKPSPSAGEAGREEEAVPMSRLRRTLAERLVQAQQTAALLTTFNEIDLSGVIGLRKEHGEAFLKRYGVKLGFMSFFVKACIDALKLVPQVNAEIRGTEIVYRNYHDIGVAVGGGRGLVVPILRNAERMSFAEIELAIGDFARRAKENKLKLEELQGGTFTISNGGVYGSMLSTPIVNPPQSGILGMHTIEDRPVARDGAVVIRPMMFAALTYDHRLVDGREAVTFLKRVKETIEAPARMLMEI